MWGRVVEMMTGVWLLVSPFVFRAQQDPYLLWGDVAVAVVIFTLSGLSYWHPTRHAHWLLVGVAIGLVLVGRFATSVPPSPAQQNHIFVGLFLLMMAIIPNQASLPPASWQERVSHL